MPYYAKRSPCSVVPRPHFISYVDSLTCVRAHDNGVGSSTAIRATIRSSLAQCATCVAKDILSVLGAGGGRHRCTHRNDWRGLNAKLDIGALYGASVFCPCPRGDSAHTKRLFSTLAAGCIPVIISDKMVLPFAEHVDLESAVLRIPEKAFSSRWRRRHFSLLDFLRNATGATPERPSTPAVERLQRAGARAVGALTFGHACRAPGGQCESAAPDALDFILRRTFDALPIDVASPESFRRRFPQHWCN